MNSHFGRVAHRCLLPLTACLALAFAGCFEKRVVWSPDGSRAVILSKDKGLYLCDAEGRLTGKLATDIKLAEWAGNAERLVLTREFEGRQWSAIAPLLSRETRERIEAQADALRDDLLAGKMWGVVQIGKTPLVKMSLRDRHAEKIRAKVSDEDWHGLQPGHLSVTLTQVLTARVKGDTVELGRVLLTTLGEIADIRPSRSGDAAAYTASSDGGDDDHGGDLMVISLTSQGPAQRVAANVAAYPDWHADGRSLVYLQAQAVPGRNDDSMVLGVLARRFVLDDSGAIAVKEEAQYLAGGLFSSFAHVRCLRDGRILFSSVEMTFPMAMADYDGDHREQLFAIDPERQSTLVRLIPRGRELDVPQILSFFEVSPDERQVVFGGLKNHVAVLTLATGEVKVIQEPDNDNAYQGLPSWRKAGELCYVKRAKAKDGVKQGRPAEVVLRSGDKEVVLSKSWPDDVLENVASNDSR